MTALKLYKFIKNNNIEYHWIDNDTDVVMFVGLSDLDEFYRLLMPSLIFEDEGIQCNMKDRYFCFKMDDICSHFDIDINEIFDKE